MTFADPPRTPLRRALYRAPVWIYRLGLGAVLGGRFLLLTHRGRVTGRARQTVLEVIGRDEDSGGVLAVSGYGGRSQWYRNVRADPRVLVETGRRRYRGTAVLLPPRESGRALAGYAHRRPRTAAGLIRALGHEPDSAGRVYERLGADPENGIPVIALRPDT
ncbi:nitroreductase family deazaflavin-dependent oxidoreductase [Streptomonospora salina]|uniref:Deazaflavin-dependent oxidoreductase (Nitroreductase family) n=1 Tax=Streptomonospora salina TaxID=104205 RepID=A0A841EFT5_9ACTN|nr:nitroreductase family deazaflavin-dependent oxidoreductase [Streptomonospora salina]MBB6000199.1 deazaflavin-dependent oxidoreductase (nitroreductase family) [Streptomonospora salina]